MGAHQQTRSDKPFVRSAKAGSWKSQLPKQSVAAIESAWGEIMQSWAMNSVSDASRPRATPSVAATRTRE